MRPIEMALKNLLKVKLHPEVEIRILSSQGIDIPNVSARQHLVSGVLRVLGQPLGVGQGNNPTCQSARAISMWSQHSPARLVNMVLTAATQNNLPFRFEKNELHSRHLSAGLVQQLDTNLDAVSIVLVPHLDKIYGEMIRLASGRLEDPHKWVNPALYGNWIQFGFASAYDYMSNSIFDFQGFVRIFYCCFHLDYNGQQRMVYPNPVGIFLTSTKGARIGFHAVSLLRVDRDNEGQIRAYFLNPNNEGRQDWGQGICPTVYGYNERPGESSLPFHQFAARIYAFHFNPDQLINLHLVPESEIQKVDSLAQESWGKSYDWNQTARNWFGLSP